MMTYKRSAIVLVGFPHTDLQAMSKRPALVLYDAGDQDIVVARITTQEYTTEADYKIKNWQASGLLAASYVRLGKLATIEKQFILRLLGTLESEEILNVKAIIKKIFGL